MIDIKSISFIRNENTPNGKSTVTIKELNNTKDYILETFQEKKIGLRPLKVSNPKVKCYVVIEHLLDSDIVLVDLIYGDFDLNAIKENKFMLEKFENFLSRENIDMITRKYLGATSEYYFKDIGLAFKEDSYKVQRTVVTTLNEPFEKKSTRSKNADTEGKGIFGFFRRGKKKDDKQESTSNLAIYSSSQAEENKSTQFKSGQGIIFYPCGASIIAGKVCTKFAYCTKDVETGEFVKIDAFLANGVDLIRLHDEEYYRNRFVNQMCVPSRLRNTRLWRYPYIGCFSNELKFENDFEITSEVDKLRKEEKMNEGKTSTE